MLTLQHLSRQSSAAALFCEVGVSLMPGCLLRLAGRNGSGKTTLLDMIAGKQAVLPGQILFAGQETRGDKEFFAEMLYLPEGFPHYSSRVTVRRQLEKWCGREQRDLIEAALNYFELKYVADCRLGELSTGWLMKLKLSLLILNPSLIWLLDRPFYALDERGRGKLEALIAGRCQQNGIVIFTHDGETRLNPHHTLNMEDWIG